MILLFGGTTEGKRAAALLDDLKVPYIYSTKSSDPSLPDSPFARYRHGALDEEGLRVLCKEEDVSIIIDAAHPFASELHRTIANIAERDGLRAIRYEREIPERSSDEGVQYVSNYDAAIELLEAFGTERLLALTGVQSITALHPFWSEHEAWFRILPRESSREAAKRTGFDPEHLIEGYPSKSVEEELGTIERTGAEAILTKESGGPGRIQVKKEAAQKSGIPLLVIERPELPSPFIVRSDEAELRALLEKEFQERGILRYGYTTGTSAAAAGQAALRMLLHDKRVEEGSIELPNGGTARLPIEEVKKDGEGARAIVIKDGGDDPDATLGARIQCRVTLNADGEVRFFRGEGVGTVTLDGIGIPVGEPAINPVPRRMIADTLKALLQEASQHKGVDVTISVENGEKIAKRTLNERVGIEAGISILGTSGIVTPYSKASYIGSIEQGIGIALKAGCRELSLNAGGRSEKMLQEELGHLPDQAFIQYGNWIGETLERIQGTEIQKVWLGLMLGKAVKLAEGQLDTSSRTGSKNNAFLSDLAGKVHPSRTELSGKIQDLNMAGKLTDLLPFEKEEPFYRELAGHCLRTCRQVLSTDTELILGLIDKQGRVLWYEEYEHPTSHEG